MILGEKIKILGKYKTKKSHIFNSALIKIKFKTGHITLRDYEILITDTKL